MYKDLHWLLSQVSTFTLQIMASNTVVHYQITNLQCVQSAVVDFRSETLEIQKP